MVRLCALLLLSMVCTVSAVAQPANQPVTMIDGGSSTVGAKADAKSTSTDTTPITLMSVMKQISASIQSAASSLTTILANSTALTPYHLTNGTTASNNSTSIKGSAGSLGIIGVFNDGTGSATTINYLKIYDSASAPTCSSATNLKHVFPIPVSATVAGLIWNIALNESYANGIGFCVVGGSSDTDNTNGVTGIKVEASYK